MGAGSAAAARKAAPEIGPEAEESLDLGPEGPMGPVSATWINQGLEPGVRATVLSAASQSDALGQIVGGPIVGAVGTAWSIRAAMVTSGGILTPILLLYAFALRKV